MMETKHVGQAFAAGRGSKSQGDQKHTQNPHESGLTVSLRTDLDKNTVNFLRPGHLGSTRTLSAFGPRVRAMRKHCSVGSQLKA